MDAFKNFAYTTVATAPSPATSGTSLVVASGEGANFPQPTTDGPFNVVICPVGTQPTVANAEIARCTARSTDTLTLVRAQEGSSPRTVVIGDQLFLAVTKKAITDLSMSDLGVRRAGMHGFLVWTCPAEDVANTPSMTAGVLQLARIEVPETILATNIITNIGTGGTTISNCFAGLFDSSGNRIAVTADLSTSWNSAGLKSNPISGGAITLIGAKDTYYYVAHLCGAGTPVPTFSRKGISSTGMTNLNLAATALRAATYSSALTAIPSSITLASMVAASGPNWAAIS